MPLIPHKFLPLAIASVFFHPAFAQTDAGSSMLTVSPEQPRAFVDAVRVYLKPRADCIPVVSVPAVPANDLPYCVVTWTSLPAGLAQDATENAPRLTGKILAAGAARVGYTLSMVDGIIIAPQASEIGAVEIVSSMPAPRADIKGPKSLASGVPARFTANVKDHRVPADLATLRGEWTLPDGSKTTGWILTWTPAEADFGANRQATLQFRAWVDGFEAESVSYATSTVSINNVWPRFVLDTRTDGNIAPYKTRMRVGIDPADRDLSGQFGGKNPLRVTWNLPNAGISLKKAEKFNAEFSVTEAGNYPISVEVADARGRSTILQATLEALAPADFDLRWEIKKSNVHQRRPVEFRLEPHIVGGHPRDRLTAFNYSVNGQPVAGNASKTRIVFDQAGTHEVRLDAQSKLGFAISKTLPLTVVPNQLPQCSMHYDYTPVNRGGERSILLRMSCTDTDGKVKAYMWSVDGALNKSASTNGLRYTYNVAQCADSGASLTGSCPQNVVFDVTVTDDSGDAAQFQYAVPRLYSQCAAQAEGRCNAGDTVQQEPSNGTSNSGRKS